MIIFWHINRIAHFALLVFSYFISKWIRKPILPGRPVSLSIEPTTSCNLRCQECPSGLRSFTRPTGMLAFSTFRKLIDQTAPHLVFLNLYFQGEPYLNPQFLDFVRYARKKGIYTSSSTNAHYLSEERARETVASGLNRLIVSVDGTTQEIYEAYRTGGRLDRVLEGTRRLIKWKKKLKSRSPKIVFQFLVVKPNEHQIGELKLLAIDIAVDEVSIKTAQIGDYKNGSALLPENPKYSRYRLQDDGTYAIKNPLKNQCWKMWHSCVVTWDGRAVPCCFDKDARHEMGNIKRSSLNEIWKSSAYHSFRKKLLQSRSSIDICTNCTEGMKIYEK